VGGLDALARDHGGRGVEARPPIDLPKGLHNLDTTGMDRQRISSGAAFEDRVGYSRAVRVGSQVWVSGTAPILPDNADPPDDAYEQARICFRIIESALGQAGAAMGDVVRSRMFLTSAADIEAVGRAHQEALGQARPASTAVVTALLDPRWRVEIEVEAVIGEPR
jgi:enamine deaminase RidA (YjgF/YER057c/UK114 family)